MASGKTALEQKDWGSRAVLGDAQRVLLHAATQLAAYCQPSSGALRWPWARAMLSEELSTDMDRITQLQDAILDLLTITSTAIEYITHRTQFEQTSAAIPTTLHTAQATRRKDYRASIETFVADIVRRARDVETLIAALPSKDDSAARATRLEELQAEMLVANADYKDALAQAESLLKELKAVLRVALGDGTEHNIVTNLTKVGLASL